MKRQRKLPPLDDNPVFQALLRDLRKQTPDQLDRLKTMLDSRIRGTDDSKNGSEGSDIEETQNRAS